MLQATILDCGSFDLFSFEQDGLSAAEVDVGRREIVQALMITAMVVVVDERVDPGFEVAGQIIVFQQDAVLERLMPAFDLALSRWASTIDRRLGRQRQTGRTDLAVRGAKGSCQTT